MVWRLVVSTVAICFRHRVTGLAAEAAFFAVVSLPLALGVRGCGSVGFTSPTFRTPTVDQVRQSLLDAAGTVLNDTTINNSVRPCSTTSSRAAAAASSSPSWASR